MAHMTHGEWLVWLQRYRVQLDTAINLNHNSMETCRILMEEFDNVEDSIELLRRTLLIFPCLENRPRAGWPRQFNRNALLIVQDGFSYWVSPDNLLRPVYVLAMVDRYGDAIINADHRTRAEWVVFLDEELIDG